MYLAFSIIHTYIAALIETIALHLSRISGFRCSWNYLLILLHISNTSNKKLNYTSDTTQRFNKYNNVVYYIDEQY